MADIAVLLHKWQQHMNLGGFRDADSLFYQYGKPPPQDSRLSAVSPSRATAFTPTHKILDGDFSIQITYHAAERIKWSAFSATKMAQLCRVIFSKQ